VYQYVHIMFRLTSEDRRAALGRWPDEAELLSDRARSVWGAWDELRVQEVQEVFNQLSNDLGDSLVTVGGVAATSKWRMTRSLVVHQVQPPDEELAPLSDGEVSQLHVVAPEVDNMDNAALALQLQRMADQLKEAQSTIAALVQRDNEVDDTADVTSGYEVCDEVIAVIPRSYLDVPPLSTKEHRRIIRGSRGRLAKSIKGEIRKLGFLGARSGKPYWGLL
jgi:hypothetical protein